VEFVGTDVLTKR